MISKRTIKNIIKVMYNHLHINTLLNIFIRDNKLISIKIINLIIRGGVKIGRNCKLYNCRFSIKGNNNKLIIKDNCCLRGLRIMLEGNNNTVIIGSGTIVNASKIQPTIINAVEGFSIKIGNGCLLSNNIEIHTTDYHSIIIKDDVGNVNRINKPKDIIIEDNVWIGLRTIVLKGSHIKANSVVAAGSIVTSKFINSNVVIAGNPAIIKRENINWIKEKL